MEKNNKGTDRNDPNSNVNNEKDNKDTNSQIDPIIDTIDCENIPNPEGQGNVLLAPREETCPGSRMSLCNPFCYVRLCPGHKCRFGDQ